MLGGSSESPLPSGTRIVRWNEISRVSPEGPFTWITSLLFLRLDEDCREHSRLEFVIALVRVMLGGGW